MKSKTYIAVPPGATIKEQLLERSMSQKEFSMRMDMSEKHISKLINGEVQLTCEVANRLEMVLGIPARYWNNLEAIYREKILLVQQELTMASDIEIMKKFPYKEMANNGWVTDTKRAEDRVIALRKYFEVVNLSLLNKPFSLNVLCRQLSTSDKTDYKLLAWIQKARLEARNIDVNKINVLKLKRSIPTIKSMTREDPEVFTYKLKSILKECGIALVLLPHIGGSFLHGATFIENKKIVLGLTVRGKYADKFWFSLFHELGHIILGHIHEEYYSDTYEAEADMFARDTLITEGELNLYLTNHDISKESLAAYSKEINIDTGLLVGRLQNEGYIEYNQYNELRRKYKLD